MTDKTTKPQTNKAPSRASDLREARLKAALKANMARRKAQAKQRGAEKNVPEQDLGLPPDESSGTHIRPDESTGTQEQPDASSGTIKE